MKWIIGSPWNLGNTIEVLKGIRWWIKNWKKINSKMCVCLCTHTCMHPHTCPANGLQMSSMTTNTEVRSLTKLEHWVVNTWTEYGVWGHDPEAASSSKVLIVSTVTETSKVRCLIDDTRHLGETCWNEMGDDEFRFLKNEDLNLKESECDPNTISLK